MTEKYSLNGGAVNLGEYGATKSRRDEDKIRMIPDDEVSLNYSFCQNSKLEIKTLFGE